MRKSIILAGSALAVAAVVGTAGPALASGSPVNVSASVNSNTTLTGITGAITFPAGNAGDTKTVLHAEQYTASSNSAAGYALTISPSSDHMAGPGGAALDNSVSRGSEGEGRHQHFVTIVQIAKHCRGFQGGSTGRHHEHLMYAEPFLQNLRAALGEASIGTDLSGGDHLSNIFELVAGNKRLSKRDLRLGEARTWLVRGLRCHVNLTLANRGSGPLERRSKSSTCDTKVGLGPSGRATARATHIAAGILVLEPYNKRPDISSPQV